MGVWLVPEAHVGSDHVLGWVLDAAPAPYWSYDTATIDGGVVVQRAILQIFLLVDANLWRGLHDYPSIRQLIRDRQMVGSGTVRVCQSTSSSKT